MRRPVLTFALVGLILALGCGPLLAQYERAPKKPAIVLAAFGTTEVSALKSILNVQDRIAKAFPGYQFDVTKQQLTEEAAYRFCWPMSTGTWRTSPETPSGYLIEGHAYIQKWGAGGLGIGGSPGCMRSCFNYLENKKAIEQTFHGGPFIKRPRWRLTTAGQMPADQEAKTAQPG